LLTTEEVCRLLFVSVPIATTGCGGAPRADKAYCVYSVYRAFYDQTRHHLLWGALNAHQALRTARRALAKNQP